MRFDQQTRSAPAILVVSILLAACAGTGPATTPGATPQSLAPTTGPIQPTQVAQASAAPRLLQEGAALTPGSYTTRFQPGFTLTLIRGVVDVSGSSWIDYEFGHDPTYELFINRIDKVPDLKHPGALLDPPKDLIAWLTNIPGRTALGSPVDVKVGGLDARQVDVSTTTDDAWPGQDPDSATQIPSGLPGHHTVRMIVVNVGGRQVLITYQAQEPGTTHFYAAVIAFQALVDTIVWN
jgi:hypothetical protein